jgi:DNA repair protein RecN (Recombination protein N)
VFKDNSRSRTVTDIKKLTEQERITEIAKMIGGAQPTALTLENARELMNP